MKKILALTLSLLCVIQTAGLAYDDEKKNEEEQYQIIVEISDNKSVASRTSAGLMGESFGVTPETLYTDAINGFSAKATGEEIEKLQNSPEVLNVFISRQYFVPAMLSSEGEKGVIPLSLLDGYCGQGTAIAVLDSEFLVDHEYFALTDETSVKYAKSDISAKLTELNISASADDVYKSAKVPFAYDYAGNDNNTVSSQYHGTSVAGVAAGQNSTHKGSAPEAQLVLMKVFTDQGAANDTTVLAAIDDAIKLGVDVINLSFGFEAGFSSPLYERAFENARESGILVTCAAGNNAMAEYTSSGTGKGPLAANPDYGTIASPASEDSATAVGAAESTGTAMSNNGFQSVSGTMAPFSSRGATSDLKLKPELSGRGSGVYLPHGSNQTSYSTGSGTSFSAPYIAGLSASLKGYINENYNVPEGDKPLLCENLLIATSDVISNGGVPYSPRAQGAGAANIEKAISTPAVLYGSLDGKAKAELGDMLSNTISFSFTAKNLTGNDVTYSLCGAAVTDDYITEDSESRIKMTSRPLTGAEFSFSGGNSVTVPAFSSGSIEVTLTLDNSETEALTEIFPNGFFIDGFIQLSNDLNPTLNLPFTGFYGNWLSVPIFDAPVSRGGGEYDFTGLVSGSDYLGSVYGGTEVRDSYMAVKPGADMFFAAALFRNVSEMNVEIIDSIGNAVKTEKIGTEMKKVFYTASHTWNYEGSSSWKWEKTIGALSEGTYTCKITAILDCNGSSGTPQSVEFNVFVDSTAPRISDIRLILNDTGYRFNIEAEDNHMAGIVGVSDTKNNLFSAMENNFAAINGVNTDFQYIQVWDCAGNVGYAQLSASNGYIAYYDRNKLINVIGEKVALWNDKIITGVESENSVKIFAWDGLCPVAKRESS